MSWIGSLILVSLAAIACQRSYEFVVPQDFEGPVVIVFDDPGGVDSDGELRVPEDGILFVKAHIRQGTFGVYAESPDMQRRRLSCTTASSDGPQCLNLLSIGGRLNGCLPESAMPFNLVTFVVASNATASDLERAQEQAVREATMRSLEHRGQKDVSDCYRDRPHVLGSYLKSSRQ